ncbi:MAG: [FeFe] hydrogenase H-cluster radical SAM maturase HydE [Planctomycetota bacterium]|nr:MAG: [FeFe] hydrogenase H-cluster radical SAM maturase HydE [Planctomycetota bacterium]
MTCSRFHVRATENEQVIVELLREEDEAKLEELWTLADEIRLKHVGDEVHLRGLIEFSNECVRGCTYCGIRSGNRNITRYRMTGEEILECAATAHSFGYGTVVLQSGEDDNMPAEWLGDIVQSIKRTHPLAVTLCVGERPLEDYRLWREKGADRYLLKIETSDPELFRRIHPPRRQDEPTRTELLMALRELGYETGGGIMVGLPGQTYSSVARDLKLFAELDLDMIGVGPYVPHPRTPLGREFHDNRNPIPEQVPNTELMTHKALALTRILCPEANLPSTTSLASVSSCGFEGGLEVGANVIMPNLTPLSCRAHYQIYPKTSRRPPEELHEQVIRSILAAGRKPGRGRGDSLKMQSPDRRFQK